MYSETNGIRRTQTICVVNINNCADVNTTAPNICACVNKHGDLHSLLVKREAEVSQSGLMLEAALHSGDIFNPSFVQVNIGTLPVVTDSTVYATYVIDDSYATELLPHQNIFVCENEYFIMEFCAEHPNKTAMLTVTVNSQTTVTDKSCLHIAEQLDFSLQTTHRLEFVYSQSGSCEVNATFTVDFQQRYTNCSDVTTSPSPTSPVSTTTTPPPPRPPVRFCYPSDANSPPQHVYTLPTGTQVLCDTLTEGGGWVTMQRRNFFNQHVNFDQNWANYSLGFGDIHSDFWLGLNTVHYLCNEAHTCQLRVELGSGAVRKFAEYINFYVSGPDEWFTLNVGNYSGDAGDALLDPGISGFVANNMSFSTSDQDHDLAEGSCAVSYTSGWWHNDCSYGNLNAPWKSIYNLWYPFAHETKNIDFTEMKIRLE